MWPPFTAAISFFARSAMANKPYPWIWLSRTSVFGQR
jgi:hypothetical protein